MWFKGELNAPPKIPNYRKSRGLYQVAFTNQTIKYNHFEGYCRLPLANGNKEELVNPEIIIPGGNGFNPEQIAEVRIIPSNGKLWAEYVYKTEETKATGLDYTQAVGIDLGVNNLATAVSTLGKSFIIDGKKLKFINQKFNKLIAKYKQGKADFYWDEKLDEITHKRNCQVRDYINKTARFLINHCLANGIGNMVVGWNEGNKQEINIGKRNNQNFVQIPLARLKNRIKEIAESVGIVFTETEESYTSKSSFLDNVLLPKFGEKPIGDSLAVRLRYEFAGKRIKRGLYQTLKKCLINADCNGAANILRKVTTQLKLSLVKVDVGVLTLPKRYFLTDLCKEYRKKAERAMALA
jgi:IS605 OrfB family transposase